MTSRYQHLAVVERIEATFGPLANIWDRRHEVWRFESTRISQLAPIVTLGDTGERELHLARWGLLPHWFRKSEAEAKRFQSRTFNARSETAHEKASFKTALQRGRCLVPAVSFSEWVTRDGSKQELRISRIDGAPLVFAGLCTRWRPDKTSEKVHTFTILTTSPSEDVAAVHSRMPVVLEPAAWDRWLSTDTTVEAARALLLPAPAGTLRVAPAPA